MPVRGKATRPPVAQLVQSQVRVDYAADGSLIWTHTPPPLALVKAERIKWRPIWCAGFDLDAAGNKHYHHIECIECHCPPGPQMQQQMCSAREIGNGGGRGSAKSEGTFGFLSLGNIAYDVFTGERFTLAGVPADATYLNCPDYSFLVLRKNSKDLLSYFKRASRYFENLGGEMTQEPMGVKFPRSGAFGIFDHLADEGAYEKYVGQEFTRIVVEEANQIPDERRYLRIKASCRTSNPNMKAQLALTFNPGSRWVKSRFIMPGGQRQPFGRVYADPYSGQTRVMIFSTVDDNPYQLASGYDKELDSLRAEDKALYLQWRSGDFDVQQNQFFPMFREQRREDEPANACHILPPIIRNAEGAAIGTPRDPAWPIAISCDWGYSHPAAVHWGAWSPKKQLHIYREFVVSQMGERELGAEIAQRSLDDLNASPSPHFNLYLSHDAFHRENEGPTEASRIIEGIDSVLGKGAAFLFDRTEEERLLDDDVSWESVKRRAQQRRAKTYITVINAGMRRRGNMNLIRDYMRWTPLTANSMQFDGEKYRNIMEREGEHNAEEYRKLCAPKPAEVLPILQIYYDGEALDPRDRGCEKLVGSIPMMIEKENNREDMEKVPGDDCIDSLAYLAGSFKFQLGYVSDEDQIRQKIQAIRDRSPNIDMNALVRVAEKVEFEHHQKHSHKGIAIPRVIGPLRHRMGRTFTGR